MIAIEEIRRAREVLDGTAIRTPLVRLDVDADAEIWLKLEVLQPVRSFKIRGAGNAILQATDAELAGGVLTASAGNMAQGVAYAARLRGVPATIVVPEHAPQTKIDAIERYGGRVIKVPYEEWWQVLVTGRYEGVERPLHPSGRQRPRDGGERDDRARAARAARRLRHRRRAVRRRRPADRDRERRQGGAARRALLRRPSRRRARRSRRRSRPATPTAVEYTPSFVDGSGSRELIPRVWEQASQLLDGAFALPLDEVAAAVRLIAERARVIAEGAGALAVATALSGRLDGREEGRLHRLGRQHRPGRAEPDPRRRAAVNVDALRAAVLVAAETASRSSTRPAARRCRTRSGRRSRTRCATRRATSARRTRPGRAVEAILERAKADAGRFLGCTPDEISFGMNMTTLDFAISRAAGRDFAAATRSLTTQLDHDGGVAPWVELAADKGMEVRVARATDELTVDYDDLERQLTDRTRVVAFAIASNATGSVADAKRICALAREAGAISWIDAVHYAAHEPIDVAEIGCDVLLCSPYKFCGPHLGIAYVRARAGGERGGPYKARPSAATPVGRKFETGTLPYELLAGFSATIAYLDSIGGMPRSATTSASSATHLIDEPAGERRRSTARRRWRGACRRSSSTSTACPPSTRRTAWPSAASASGTPTTGTASHSRRACRSSRCAPGSRTTTRVTRSTGCSTSSPASEVANQFSLTRLRDPWLA